MTRRLRVSAVPVGITIGDLDGNLRAVGDTLAAVDTTEPHLVVLPELATSGYVFADRAEARASALAADDPRLTALAECLPDQAVAVVGFCERDGTRLYNSALVITAGGVLGCYRKSHLWDTEHLVFDAGPEAGLVLDTPIGRLGVAICYDNEFPELPRRLALAGAEVLALPVNWPLVDRPVGERPPEIVQAMAAARSSRLATVVADRRGSERGVHWTGGTCVISPDGWVCAEAAGEAVTAVLHLSEGKALNDNNDLLADRRPELYGELLTAVRPEGNSAHHV